MASIELSIRTLARSGFFVAGLLLVAIGVGDLVVGRTKLAQYHAEFSQVPSTRPRDRSTLFPKVTEVEEQRAVARAKIGYYNLLFLAGQILTLAGLVLLVIGLVRIRRTAQPTLLVARSR